MNTMNAALQDKTGTFRIAEVPRPVAGPADVVVWPRSVGICGSDLHVYGARDAEETTAAGHEVAGEVAELGDGAGTLKVGDRVAIDGSQSVACGKCWYCRTGQYFHCQDSATSGGGGFAELMMRGANGCYPLPDSLSWEEAGLVEPFAVSVHAVRISAMSAGETVAVLGSGTIGLTAVAAARAMGAGKVFATARHAQQAAMARRLGADDVVAPDGEALREVVAEATDGRGADLTIETVGGASGATLHQACEVTRNRGRVVILGLFTKPVSTDWWPLVIKEQTIIPAVCYSVIDGRHDYEVAIDLMASGRVELKQLVTHKFPLAEIQQAFDTAADKSTGAIKVQVHS